MRQKVASLTPDNPIATDIHQSHLPGGKVAWHEWTDRALFDAHGRVTELQSIGRDITERKQAEEVMAISEARYRTLILLPGNSLISMKTPCTSLRFKAKRCSRLGP